MPIDFWLAFGIILALFAENAMISIVFMSAITATRTWSTSFPPIEPESTVTTWTPFVVFWNRKRNRVHSGFEL
jgi:hypothetical protein